MSDQGYIAVDLDGTLAHYDGWRGPEHIGNPILPMVARVKGWLKQGTQVKIMTARVGATGKKNDADGRMDDAAFAEKQRQLIKAWCKKHIGIELEVTATKCFGMIRLYDARCVQVEANTGRLIEDRGRAEGRPRVEEMSED